MTHPIKRSVMRKRDDKTTPNTLPDDPISRLRETPTIRKEMEEVNRVLRNVKWPPGFFDKNNLKNSIGKAGTTGLFFFYCNFILKIETYRYLSRIKC